MQNHPYQQKYKDHHKPHCWQARNNTKSSWVSCNGTNPIIVYNINNTTNKTTEPKGKKKRRLKFMHHRKCLLRSETSQYYHHETSHYCFNWYKLLWARNLTRAHIKWYQLQSLQSIQTQQEDKRIWASKIKGRSKSRTIDQEKQNPGQLVLVSIEPNIN